MKRLARVVASTTFVLVPLGEMPATTATESRPPLHALHYAERTVHGRDVLAYDISGDGRVVEVLGDVSQADYIAVVVPGSGHRLADYWTTNSTTGPRSDGLALLTELRRQASSARTAVVVWLGYDTPENLDLVAARSDRAVAGGRDLARLVRRLPAHASVTLIGHSYGSVVVGRAGAELAGANADADPGTSVRTATVVDNLVFVGSPGVDADTAADVGASARTTVWAARALDDPIRWVPHVRVGGLGHGVDPVSAGFGASVFDTGSITGHDQYYAPGSESLANLARIVLGRTDEVTGVAPAQRSTR